MHHKLVRFHAHASPWRYIWSEPVVSLILLLLVFAAPAMASTRFTDRSLNMQSARPGATTSYTVSFRYMTQLPVGSVVMSFCIYPIPYHPCVTPPGLDASNAALSSQSGETGYSILSKTPNHIVLTRLPTMISSPDISSYRFDNIVNPTDVNQSFSIRLRSHSTPDATGSQIDFGSVKGQVTSDITIETQVPPMLIFCVAGQVEENCNNTNDNNYSDMGQLSAQSTLLAQSQMAVGTNASGGFAITANGNPMSAGTNVIDSPTTPTESKQGSNQFGINLVANNAPTVGSDPEGAWANATPSPDYSIPNKYKYVSGDVVAFSPDVSLMKKFTVSYIVNSSENLRAGVYTTTITYVASGRF
jgi:hypothetical protein